ncbi:MULTISPECIES: hypothetical protein [unclassified Mesorhizobium]|uniref:hypothetical protein n=1 Tax=unclassified Mesorhizobium TaxID=325217 RepID=UPI003338F43A
MKAAKGAPPTYIGRAASPCFSVEEWLADDAVGKDIAEVVEVDLGADAKASPERELIGTIPSSPNWNCFSPR